MNEDQLVKLSAFSSALKRFQKLDPDSAINALFELFSLISQAGKNDLIAMLQTVDTFQAVVPLNEQQVTIVNSLRTAVCKKAQVVAKRLAQGKIDGWAVEAQDVRDLDELRLHFSAEELYLAE
jgi:hypothetical protein